MEPLYNGHHWDPHHFVRYSEVSLTRTSGIFPIGMVLRNPAVEYNMAAFSELSSAVRKAKQRLLLQVTALI